VDQLVVEYGEDGSLEVILRVARDPVPSDRVAFARLGGRGPVAEFLPAIGALRLGSDGCLWVQEYVPPYENRSPTWWVFDSDGSILARTVLPNGFRLRHVGFDHLLGIRLDEFEVNYVERYQIMR